MATYNVTNEKYNINFDLKFESFYNFIESLKESKKYYYDYCNLKNINIVEFDNEYIENINILKSELLKIYILITNDDVDEKFVVINEQIKALYNSIIKYPNTYENNRTIALITHEIINSLNINYLTREKVSLIIKTYAYYVTIYGNEHKLFNKNLLHDICIDNSVIIGRSSTHDNSIKKLNNYLDLLDYESIYEKELDKILINLPNICISNIQSKKLLNNISNEPNLIDLHDLHDKYIAVD